jgi:choline dehydrogenase-like flavoprotein
MDHLTGVGAVGEFPSLRDSPFQSGRPATSCMPRFRNLDTSDADFAGGYAMICDAFRPSPHKRGVFAEARDCTATAQNDWVARFWGFGECMPDRTNRVTLDRQRCDAWGIPTLNIEFSWGDNDLAMARDMATSAAETLEAAGARNVRALDTLHRPGLAIHEMGTARMGHDARSSVVNGYGQCHDLPNLFLVDGAIMPASPCQNPSLTYMALSSRAACHAVALLRRGELRPAPRAALLSLGSGERSS